MHNPSIKRDKLKLAPYVKRWAYFQEIKLKQKNKFLILSCLLSVVSGCATTKYVPALPVGQVYEDKSVKLEITAVKADENRPDPTCIVGIKASNISSSEIEPNFKFVFLGPQGNTVYQKDVQFPLIYPNKFFSGATYTYACSCSRINSVQVKRVK